MKFLPIVFLLPALVAAEPAAVTRLDVSVLCFKTTELFADLEREYNEIPLAAGVSSSAGVVTTLWVGRTGSYTITKTLPTTDVTCVVDTGTGFRTLSVGRSS